MHLHTNSRWPRQPWPYALVSEAGMTICSSTTGIRRYGWLRYASPTKANGIGPDLVPRSGVGLKYEITQQTPSLNAVIEHSRKYPNEWLR